MCRSESIGKLTEALSKAQSVLEGALTDSDNPFFKSKYADLASVWRACRKPLTDNGLAVVQTTYPIHDNPELIGLETVLSHISGEWITGNLVMRPVKNDPQAIGSCITYMRRYSLAAIVGVSPEDDDGNAASHNPSKPEPTKTKTLPKPKASELAPSELPPPEDLTAEREAFSLKCMELAMSDAEVTQFKKFLFSKAPTKSELKNVVDQFSDKFDLWQESMKA